MFYSGVIGENLRFGDVVTGYVSVTAKIKKPFGNASIDIQIPQYSVVLDPCCDIGNGLISLSPLEEITVNPAFYENPTLQANLTLINIVGMPQTFFSPSSWNKLSNEKKTSALTAIPDYGWSSYFAYEGNPVFPEYVIEKPVRFVEVKDSATNLPIYEAKKEPLTVVTRYRVVNFKNIYRVSCESIVKTERLNDRSILGSIVLQLSKETRNILREKMAYYYSRIPLEDAVVT
jgi:hypothetical protein